MDPNTMCEMRRMKTKLREGYMRMPIDMIPMEKMPVEKMSAVEPMPVEKMMRISPHNF